MPYLDNDCYEAVGIPLLDLKEVLLRPSFEQGTFVSSATSSGVSGCWALGNGIEHWMQLSAEHRMLGYAPHFVGRGVFTADIKNFLHFPDDLSCAYEVECNTLGDAPFPAVFASPNYDFLQGTLAARMDFQIAAFARKLSCFATEDEYLASQTDRKYSYGVESFVPSGLFGVPPGGIPAPTALFSGRPLSSDIVANPLTGRKFLHLVVQTLGGTIDVLSSRRAITGTPARNGIVSGHFDLSARPWSDIATAEASFGTGYPVPASVRTH